MVEGFCGLLKRGIVGSFHHISVGHLSRYCDEFSFRYNYRKVSDGVRAGLIVAGGRRQAAHLPRTIEGGRAERVKLGPGRRFRDWWKHQPKEPEQMWLPFAA
jgi:hypothetical protein